MADAGSGEPEPRIRNPLDPRDPLVGVDLGKMIGPLVGGFVAAAFGLDAMFRVVPLAFLALYVVLYLATPRVRARPVLVLDA